MLNHIAELLTLSLRLSFRNEELTSLITLKGLLGSERSSLLNAWISDAKRVLRPAACSEFSSTSLISAMWSLSFKLCAKILECRPYSFQSFIVSSILLSNAGVMQSKHIGTSPSLPRRRTCNEMPLKHLTQFHWSQCEGISSSL